MKLRPASRSGTTSKPLFGISRILLTVSLVTGMKLLRNWISDVLVSNLPAIHLTNLSGTSVFSNFKKQPAPYLSITAT
jgi:hypothetical protein